MSDPKPNVLQCLTWLHHADRQFFEEAAIRIGKAPKSPMCWQWYQGTVQKSSVRQPHKPYVISHLSLRRGQPITIRVRFGKSYPLISQKSATLALHMSQSISRSTRWALLTRVPYVKSFMLCFLHTLDIPWSGCTSTRENWDIMMLHTHNSDEQISQGTYLHLVCSYNTRSQLRANLICSETIKVTQSNWRDEAILLKCSKDVQTEHIFFVRVVLPMELQTNLRYSKRKVWRAELPEGGLPG